MIMKPYRVFLVVCSLASLSACTAFVPVSLPPGTDTTPNSADPIISDMFFTPGKTGEFPTFDLHVIVRNQGNAATQSNVIIVKVWHDETTIQGIRFRPLPPVAVVLGNLDPGQSDVAVWENVSTVGRSFFVAVVDLPTKPQFPFGRERELPIQRAEKNNTFGIPTP